MLEKLIEGLRLGLLMLRKHPSFSFIAVLTLGLGSGVNISIFGLPNALFLRSLPVQSSPELISLLPNEEANEADNFSSFAHFYLRARNTGLSGFAAYRPINLAEMEARISAKRMADGKRWTTANLNVKTAQSYCYDDAAANCRRYGRLYTWESAQRGCQSLGGGWRLPTDDEWRQLAKRYGGVSEDADDKGQAAYKALLAGGSAGFNAVLGGGRAVDGQYARLEAHGFYWTASASDEDSALFYNFGKGGLALHRQNGGEKQRAFSVRCVRE